MNIKDYAIAAGISAVAGIVIMLILLLMSAISWAIVWGIITIVCIPIVMKAIKLWQDNDCYDLEDFFTLLDKKYKKKSSISED